MQHSFRCCGIENLKTIHLYFSGIDDDVSSNDIWNILKETECYIEFPCIEWNRNDYYSNYKISFSLESVFSRHVATKMTRQEI